ADLLLVYYVGHGVVSSQGVLHLATGCTVIAEDRMEYTALPYAKVGRRVRESPARHRIVILDCCFSARALDGLSGLGEPDESVADQAALPGGFVLTSASLSFPLILILQYFGVAVLVFQPVVLSTLEC